MRPFCLPSSSSNPYPCPPSSFLNSYGKYYNKNFIKREEKCRKETELIRDIFCMCWLDIPQPSFEPPDCPWSTLQEETSLTGSLPKQTQVLAYATRCTSCKAETEDRLVALQQVQHPLNSRCLCKALSQQLSMLVEPGGFCLPPVPPFQALKCPHQCHLRAHLDFAALNLQRAELSPQALF